jgi:hypothetical protein
VNNVDDHFDVMETAGGARDEEVAAAVCRLGLCTLTTGMIRCTRRSRVFGALAPARVV